MVVPVHHGEGVLHYRCRGRERVLDKRRLLCVYCVSCVGMSLQCASSCGGRRARSEYVAVVVPVMMRGVPLWPGDKKEGERKGGTSSFVFLASPRRVAHLGFVCHDLARGGEGSLAAG